MMILEDELVREKMETLLSRQKPRDFYDLYFMLRAGMVSPQDRVLLRSAFEVVNKTKIAFDRELSVFLPRNQSMLIKDFKSVLERELERYH